ncbi:hypothetical protein BJF79_45690 [Actinomadura sp. CNU-125]|nr:hypothetical protein BJF79_45690 [Actinomadura sp. CNU-125]
MSLTGASGTNQTPSGVSATWAAAISPARRVLPAPPGPVRVTSRCSRSSSPTRRDSSSRPTKVVSCAGRFVRRGDGSAGPSRSAGAPASRRIARWTAASSGDGTAPSRSARARRVSSYASRASARRPAACRERT